LALAVIIEADYILGETQAPPPRTGFGHTHFVPRANLG